MLGKKVDISYIDRVKITSNYWVRNDIGRCNSLSEFLELQFEDEFYYVFVLCVGRLYGRRVVVTYKFSFEEWEQLDIVEDFEPDLESNPKQETHIYCDYLGKQWQDAAIDIEYDDEGKYKDKEFREYQDY